MKRLIFGWLFSLRFAPAYLFIPVLYLEYRYKEQKHIAF